MFDDDFWEMMEDFEDGFDFGDMDDFMGETDCEEGCIVEVDGTCPHGNESRALRMGLV